MKSLRLVSLTSLALTLMFSSCGKTESSQDAEQGQLIAVSFQTMNNPFFVDLNKGLADVVEAHGDRLITLDAGFDSHKQQNGIADVLLQNVAAVFINPVNWEGIRGSLLQAKQKGIPTIIVDAPVKDKELALTTVASDNLEAGRLAARALLKAMGSEAKIGILAYSLNKACIDRVAGFKEVIATNPAFIVIDEQEIKGTTEAARPVMQDMIGRHPEINAVFAINDPAALGVISALESAGKLQDVKVVAVDGAQEALAAIKSGKMLATSAQFPKEIGKTAAEAYYAHLEGKSVEPDIAVRVELIDASNVDQYLVAAE